MYLEMLTECANVLIRVNIDPLAIIMDLRQQLVLEQSAAPAALNGMFGNIENNGAPWQFSPADRANWINEN